MPKAEFTCDCGRIFEVEPAADQVVKVPCLRILGGCGKVHLVELDESGQAVAAPAPE